MATTKPAGYYDVELDVEEVILKGGLLEDVFYLKDLKQRKLFISDEISEETVGDTVRHIMQLNREDHPIPPEDRVPILM